MEKCIIKKRKIKKWKKFKKAVDNDKYMLYYKQAVADKENKSVITTEVKLMRFEKAITKFKKVVDKQKTTCYTI